LRRSAACSKSVARAPAARASALLLGAALGLVGCVGTPNPLAPGFAGSVGWPHYGVQTGAVELPVRGEGFVRYRKAGGYYWGQPSLVQSIQAAAARVQEQLPGGAPLVVGDLSARQGGRVARHASHRSGRDVDLLWYMTTPEGAPIQNVHFVQVGSDGLGRIPDAMTLDGKTRDGTAAASASTAAAGSYVRLDVQRQWLLVKSLLDPELLSSGAAAPIHVQWMFASRDVEALLIDYALAKGEDPELVWRAENVLQEPPQALPHDDHLHLRIACSPDASVQGCEGSGPYWSWLPPPSELQAFDVFDPDAEDTEQL
jgi:penicillin-insensitive murein endopeptidase